MAVAELSQALSDETMANQYFQMAEQIERGAWGNGLRQPQVMARVLIERPGRAAEALQLAEEAARGRADIFTMDTLAWAYFKNGRDADAKRAMEQALRTGTRDARIRCHADVISGRAPASTRHCLEWRP
jgi:hypothetical protein